MRNLLDQIRHWAKMVPEKVLVIDGDTTLTYAETLDRALRFAGGLNKLGVEKKSRVAAIMYNTYRFYDLYYGTSAGGQIFVPINFRLAGPEIAYQINDSGAEVLIMDLDFEPVIKEIKDSLKTVKHFVYTSEKSPFTGAIPYDSILDAAPFETDVTGADLFGIYYTGGTTGLAKGVMLSHRNILANAFNLVSHVGLKSDQIALHAAPMFHLADGAINFAVTLVGGSHVLVKVFEPLAVFEAVQKHKTTFPLWVPTMINALANHPDVDKYDLSSLKLIAYGASPVSPTLLRKAYEVFQCDFIQLYGMTEAAPIVTILTPEDHKKALADPAAEGLLKAAGRQVLGVEAKVVDIDGTEIAVGEVGEVIARGDTIMQGYWGKPIETEAALIDGWYWTKDLARRDQNNYIYIVDRAKDMIISGAENVYSIEVEDALSKHPDVMETAVVGIPDEKWGETIKGIVVLKPGASVSEEELIIFCKKYIASYKSPKSIEFIDALPKSGAGKILKRELRDTYWKDSERGVH